MILENFQQIEELFRRYLNDKCTPEEVHLLMDYFRLDENEDILKNIIQSELEKPDDPTARQNKKVKEATDRVLKEINKKKKR